jgi:hypothetical protein
MSPGWTDCETTISMMRFPTKSLYTNSVIRKTIPKSAIGLQQGQERNRSLVSERPASEMEPIQGSWFYIGNPG